MNFPNGEVVEAAESQAEVEPPEVVRVEEVGPEPCVAGERDHAAHLEAVIQAADLRRKDKDAVTRGEGEKHALSQPPRPRTCASLGDLGLSPRLAQQACQEVEFI